MSYSCTDFTDSILDALHINVPDEIYDQPSEQADLALIKIEAMERALKAARVVLYKYERTPPTEYKPLVLQAIKTIEAALS